jgi:uncharacterized protein YkwD
MPLGRRPGRPYVRCVSRRLQVYAALLLVALSATAGLGLPQAAGAASCASASALPGEATRTQLARAVVCVSNLERQAHGLRALRLNRQLSAAARRHSLDMVRRGYFAHTGPSGDTFVQRIQDAGYLRSAGTWIVGENLAWGWGAAASPSRIVRAWMHSPEHRKILLRPYYGEVGVGVVQAGPHPKAAPTATFTADFGVIG